MREYLSTRPSAPKIYKPYLANPVLNAIPGTFLWSGVELDEGGDPPRIWSPFGEYPGTAFTRSIGDVIAEELGVVADPEIIHRKIHPCDR